MKKGVFIESVFLKVNGGEINDEGAVKRSDIRAYVPAAINYAMQASYNITLQQEGNRDMSSLFYAYFGNQPVLKDAARHNWSYIAYPRPTIAFANNQGIRGVEDGDGNFFKPLSDNGFKTIQYYKDILPEKYYRPEKFGIYLFNEGPLTETVGLIAIIDSAALLDTEELPLPAGLEDVALTKCFEYFGGQRQEPADTKNDKKDIN